MKRALVIFVSVIHLVLLDAVVKELARGYLSGATRVVEVVPNVFNLAYVENRGCAWGMLQGRVWPLAVFGLAALALLIWKRKSVFYGEGVARGSFGDKIALLTECLLYAGIVGNLIDRTLRGYVIDMFDFHWGLHHFPCFNVADVCISVAAGLLVLSGFRTTKKK